VSFGLNDVLLQQLCLLFDTKETIDEVVLITQVQEGLFYQVPNFGTNFINQGGKVQENCLWHFGTLAIHL
jgi:hypothetical protein